MTESASPRGTPGPRVETHDKVLLKRIQTGSEDAATALYLRYAKRLRGLAESKTNSQMAVQMDAEGIVQSVFRTFFRRAGNGQYDVEEADGLWKLLLVIAMNKIRNRATFHRAAKRDATRNRRIDQYRESRHPVTGADAEALSILRWTIDELLEQMPEENHDIVLLRIEGLQVAEIANQTGRSKRSVERTLQQFRLMLAEQLEWEV